MTLRLTEACACESDPGIFPARIESIGIEARRLLAVLDKSHVVAVFTRSLYLRSDDAWACLGSRDIGRAPLNITCEAADLADWRHIAAVGDVPVAHVAGLSVGYLKLFAEGAVIWQNRPMQAPCEWRLARGLQLLTASLPAGLPREGLAPLLRPGAVARSAVTRAAHLPVKELSDWVWRACSMQSIPQIPREALRSLLGLGPGLTPSGDDFLAGFVSGLRATGRVDAAQALGREVMALAPACTSEVSAAHLTAVLRSGLKEDLQNLIYAISRGDSSSIAAGLRRLDVEPHYSSWDALAGVTMVFRCVLEKPVASCYSTERNSIRPAKRLG